MTDRTRAGTRALLFCAAAIAVLPEARAQTAAPQAAQAKAGTPPVEEISVTARRRKEKLINVPVSVAVVSGARAQQDNLNNLQDITTIVPSAQFRTSSSNKDRTLFVRGIGTISTSPGVEPSVSTVIDGVVMARSGQATVDLADLAQVEVLSGPQGTLFGKNASAGAINITTQAPSPDFHAWLEGDYFGSGGNEYRGTAGITGTIAPNVAASLSVLSDTFDGNVRNLYNGQRVNGWTRNGARAKFLFTPQDDLKVTLAFDYLKSVDTVPNGVFVSSSRVAYPTNVVTPNPTLAGVLAAQGIRPGLNNTTISQNLTSSAEDDNGGVGLTVEKKLGEATLTSITAWRLWQNVQRQDFDQTSAPPTGIPQLKDRGNLLFNQVSEEVRLASAKGGLIDYVIGGYYLLGVDNESYDRAFAPAGAPYAPTARGRSEFGTDATNIAGFGEANVNFTDNFRAILGLRLVRDGLSYTFGRRSSSASSVTGIRPGFSAQGSTDAFSYSDRIGLQYDITPDTNTYFTYSRGYKGPAFNVFFNMSAIDTRPLKPETSDAFEVGFKSALLDNRLQFNVAGFIEEFSNYQANFADQVAGAIVTRLINAGDVSSKGVEGSFTARPIRGLEFGTSAAYTDAQIEQFNCPPGAATSCNVNGKPLPFAPRWKLSANARYTRPIGEQYDATVATDFVWQSRAQYQITQQPDTIQQAYGIWNASISLRDFENNWRVTGLVKNILDQHYSNFIAYGAVGGVIRYVPRDFSRYFGIELRKDF